MEDISDETSTHFLRQAKEIKTPLYQNARQQTSGTKRNLTGTMSDKEHNLPRALVKYIENLESSINSILVYSMATDATQTSRDKATDNINVRLICLEDFVGREYADTIGDNLPNLTIAINEISERVMPLKDKTEYIKELNNHQKMMVSKIRASKEQEQKQVSVLLCTIITHLKGVECAIAADISGSKRSRHAIDSHEDSLLREFLRRAYLGGEDRDSLCMIMI
eukprot:15338791-Ditylum_brightwellii.AAC.1